MDALRKAHGASEGTRDSGEIDDGAATRNVLSEEKLSCQEADGYGQRKKLKVDDDDDDDDDDDGVNRIQSGATME